MKWIVFCLAVVAALTGGAATRVVVYSGTEDYTCDHANDCIRDFANVLTEGKGRATVVPREHLGSFKEVPELVSQSLKGIWLHQKDFEDKYVSERFRLLLWTLRMDPVDWTLKGVFS